MHTSVIDSSYRSVDSTVVVCVPRSTHILSGTIDTNNIIPAGARAWYTEQLQYSCVLWRCNKQELQGRLRSSKKVRGRRRHFRCLTNRTHACSLSSMCTRGRYAPWLYWLPAQFSYCYITGTYNPAVSCSLLTTSLHLE